MQFEIEQIRVRRRMRVEETSRGDSVRRSMYQIRVQKIEETVFHG